MSTRACPYDGPFAVTQSTAVPVKVHDAVAPAVPELRAVPPFVAVLATFVHEPHCTLPAVSCVTVLPTLNASTATVFALDNALWVPSTTIVSVCFLLGSPLYVWVTAWLVLR